MNMLGLAKRCRARFLLTSTSEARAPAAAALRGAARRAACSPALASAPSPAFSSALLVCRRRALNPPSSASPPPSTRTGVPPGPQVYGDPLEHPQTEGYWGNVNPIGERSCYDEGKRVAETLTMDYHRRVLGAWGWGLRGALVGCALPPQRARGSCAGSLNAAARPTPKPLTP